MRGAPRTQQWPSLFQQPCLSQPSSRVSRQLNLLCSQRTSPCTTCIRATLDSLPSTWYNNFHVSDCTWQRCSVLALCPSLHGRGAFGTCTHAVDVPPSSSSSSSSAFSSSSSSHAHKLTHTHTHARARTHIHTHTHTHTPVVTPAARIHASTWFPLARAHAHAHSHTTLQCAMSRTRRICTVTCTLTSVGWPHRWSARTRTATVRTTVTTLRFDTHTHTHARACARTHTHTPSRPLDRKAHTHTHTHTHTTPHHTTHTAGGCSEPRHPKDPARDCRLLLARSSPPTHPPIHHHDDHARARSVSSHLPTCTCAHVNTLTLAGNYSQYGRCNLCVNGTDNHGNNSCTNGVYWCDCGSFGGPPIQCATEVGRENLTAMHGGGGGECVDASEPWNCWRGAVSKKTCEEPFSNGGFWYSTTSSG
jgi:hypothetical protein